MFKTLELVGVAVIMTVMAERGIPALAYASLATVWYVVCEILISSYTLSKINELVGEDD